MKATMAMGITMRADKGKPPIEGLSCEGAWATVVVAPDAGVPPAELDWPAVVTVEVKKSVVVLVAAEPELCEVLRGVAGGTVETDLVTVVVVVFSCVVVKVEVLVTVEVAVLVAVVVTVVVVIRPAGLGEHPMRLAPPDPRGEMTETDPPPLFAT
jgi:hypothetical protein